MRRVRLGEPEEPILDSATAASLLRPAFAGLPCERIGVLHLDARRRPLGFSVSADGEPHRVRVPMREIVAEALSLGSRRMIVAHNHPANDLRPSGSDLGLTRRIVEIGRALEIDVVDHIIFGGAEWISFCALGLM